jgi:tryptophan 2,3-dioxygenase
MNMNRLFAVVNPLVVSLAGSFAHWLISHQVMVLDVTGRRSGRTYRIPVSYLRSDGDVLCMTSRDGLWWRNLSKDVPVHITYCG